MAHTILLADGTTPNDATHRIGPPTALDEQIDAFLVAGADTYQTDATISLPADGEWQISFAAPWTTWYGSADAPRACPELNDTPLPVKLRQHAYPTAPIPWVTGHVYSAGDVVSQSSEYYRCPAGQGHTSGTFADDLAAGKWVLAWVFSTAGTDTACTALTAISDLVASNGNAQSVLTWGAVANEDSFVIEYCAKATDPGTGSWASETGYTSTTAAQNATTKTITGLTNSTKYWFRIKSLGSGRYSDSAWSNNDDATPVLARIASDANDVLYYYFNEDSGTTITDYSGNGYDGTLSAGSGSLVASGGQFGDGYLNFNATEVIRTTGASVCKGDTGTIEAVLWVSEYGTGGVVWHEYSTNAESAMSYLLVNDAGKLWWITGGGSNGTGDVVLGTGHWHYIAAAWDTSEVRLYVDGTLDKALAFSGKNTDVLTYAGTGIGMKKQDDTFKFNGSMAMFRTSTVKLSAATIDANATTMGF